MKIIAVIWSLYVLGLNFTPCADGGDYQETTSTEVSLGMEEDHGHSHLDFCTPFCNCNCCHVSVTNVDIFTHVLLKLDMSKDVFFYINDLGFDPDRSFLQPPQV